MHMEYSVSRATSVVRTCIVHCTSCAAVAVHYPPLNWLYSLQGCLRRQSRALPPSCCCCTHGPATHSKLMCAHSMPLFHNNFLLPPLHQTHLTIPSLSSLDFTSSFFIQSHPTVGVRLTVSWVMYIPACLQKGPPSR